MKTEKYYQAKEALGLGLEYCGVEYCAPHFAMPTHHREVWLIHYIFQGQGTFTYRGATRTVAQGDLFAIFPGEFTSYQANAEDPFCFCWFGVTGGNAPRLMQRAGFTPEEPVFSLHAGDGILPLVNRCVELCDSPLPHAEIEMQATLYQLFRTIEAGQGRRAHREGGASHAAQEHVKRAVSFIQFNYMAPITIQQVAQQVNLERTYFSKIFREVEGVTPQEFLLRYRVDSARRLLQDAAYTVRQVGALVGIHDAYYFSRAFKKLTGQSPSAYREAAGAGK